MLFFIWFGCLTWQIAMVKLSEHFNDDEVQYFSIILLCSVALVCFMPFHCFYLTARKQLARTLGNVFITPFGKVRFRHFFLADVISSMTAPLQHVFYITCYYKRKHYVDA